MASEPRVSRRAVLGTVASGAAMTSLAGEAAAATPDVRGWLSDTSNFDRVHDRSGEDTVTVKVGVQANGGYYGFGPAAVRVSPGTTVRWVWTGKAAPHSVDAQTGASFESGLHREEGFAYTHTFQDPGVVEYFCRPHAALGMKGAVVVGDVEIGGSAGGDAATGSASGGGSPATPLGASRAVQLINAAGAFAGGFMVFLVSAMVGLTVYSIRSDRHTPAPHRED